MCPDKDQYLHGNTTMWTDGKHIILMNHYVLSPKLERFRKSVFLYFSASLHASVSQLKEIENSHLLKNSNCKPIEHTHISVNQDPPKFTKPLNSSNAQSTTSTKLHEDFF